MKRKRKLRSGSLHCSPTEGDNRNAERSVDRGVRPVGDVDVLETIRQICVKIQNDDKQDGLVTIRGMYAAKGDALNVQKVDEIMAYGHCLKDQEKTKPRS